MHSLIEVRILRERCKNPIFNVGAIPRDCPFQDCAVAFLGFCSGGLSLNGGSEGFSTVQLRFFSNRENKSAWPTCPLANL